MRARVSKQFSSVKMRERFCFLFANRVAAVAKKKRRASLQPQSKRAALWARMRASKRRRRWRAARATRCRRRCAAKSRRHRRRRFCVVDIACARSHSLGRQLAASSLSCCV